MNRTPRITRDEVHAAAQKLNEQGIKPGTMKIREMLGKGSYTTIGKFLEDWEAPESQEEEAPEVPEALSALLPQIWQACYAEAQNILRAQTDELRTQLAEAQEFLESAQAATDDAENLIEQLQAQLATAEARAEKAETANIELDRQRIVAEARAEELRQRAEAAERMATTAKATAKRANKE